MAQFVYSMLRVGKVVPPKKQILKDISLSFFPGAKIGVLGLNGSGKSSLLRIIAGVDKDYIGDFDGDGKADWMEIVTIFKRYGFEWGGDWKFNDAPHFQKTFGKSINELAELHKNDKVDKNGFVLI